MSQQLEIAAAAWHYIGIFVLQKLYTSCNLLCASVTALNLHWIIRDTNRTRVTGAMSKKNDRKRLNAMVHACHRKLLPILLAKAASPLFSHVNIEIHGLFM